jgi:enamine deaminase RidA (YjgF/YER057c/UK114 family)
VPATALKPIRFPWYRYDRYSFSLGLELGGRAFLSGHTASAFDPAAGRMRVTGGMAEQVQTAYAKIGAILEAAGQTVADIVRIVEYVTATGIERYAEAAAVRHEVLGENRPAVNTVVVRSLLRPEALIEIEVTAGRADGAALATAGVAAARESSGVVYLSSILPLDDAGDVVGAGDVVAQTRAIYARAGRVLSGAGLGFDRVVKTLDYLTPAALPAYRHTGRVRKEHLGPVYPGAAGIVMPRLSHPEAMMQVDFVAAREVPVAVNPGWTRYGKLTYSPAVRAGNLLFMSGQGSLDPETEQVVHDGDVVAQAEYTYQNVLAVVRAAGGGPESLIKTIEYVTPGAVPRYRGVADVRTRLLREPYPASTGVVCEALLRPEMQIEIDPFAVLG